MSPRYGALVIVVAITISIIHNIVDYITCVTNIIHAYNIVDDFNLTRVARGTGVLITKSPP